MWSGSRKVKKNKTPKIIKKELLVSLVEHLDGEENYLQMNEEVKNAKDMKDCIALVKKYEDILTLFRMEGTKKAPYQFPPCNFYKRRN